MKQPIFDDKNNQWSADCRVGGEPGAQRALHVAVVGSAGQAFSDYYHKVGRETGQWPAIETLPPDIVFCDSVKVRRK